MSLLDENVHQQSIVASIAAWYRGQVRSLTTLRPNTLIKDKAIPTVLRRARQPTFVTTNVADFWRRVPAIPDTASYASPYPMSVCTSYLPCCDNCCSCQSSTRKPSAWVKSSEAFQDRENPLGVGS
jgi:hypothetical protein